jgi:hypothetical protein
MARAGLAAARALDRLLTDDDVGRRRLRRGLSNIIQGPPQRGLGRRRIHPARGLDAVDVGPLDRHAPPELPQRVLCGCFLHLGGNQISRRVGVHCLIVTLGPDRDDDAVAVDHHPLLLALWVGGLHEHAAADGE